MKYTLADLETAELDTIRDEWVNHALHGSSDIDRDKADELVRFVYGLAGLEAPSIFYVQSPLAAQLAAGIFRDAGCGTDDTFRQVWSRVFDRVWEQVIDQVTTQVTEQVEAQVIDQVESSPLTVRIEDKVVHRMRMPLANRIRGAVSDLAVSRITTRVWNRVWEQVQQNVANQADNQVFRQVSEQLRNGILSRKRSTIGDRVWMPPLRVLSAVGWVAHFDVFARLGVATDDNFLRYRDLVRESGVWEFVPFVNIAVVTCRPSAVRVNADFNLHSDSEPAVEWPDGFRLWFLRGVNFEFETWKKIVDQSFELSDLMKMEDADTRAVAVSMLRADRLLEHVNAVHVHTGVKGTRLYRVPDFMDTGSTEYCMTMTCPSTGREFLEWVAPEIGMQGDADLAQASAWTDEDGNALSIEDYLTMTEA